jgi:Acetyltransferase (GNAT) domain
MIELSSGSMTEQAPPSEESFTPALYELDPLRDHRWQDLVMRHANASVFHSTNWLAALRSVYGYEPVVITSTQPGIPLANGIVVCRIKSWLTGSRLVSLPFSDHCEPLVSCADEFDPLLARMRHYVDAERWKYIELRPIRSEPNVGTCFSKGVGYCFHRLDLRKSEQELFRSFHKDCVQRKIRRAERESLQYEEGSSERLLRSFYRLLVMTRRRQNLPPQPLGWFRALIAQFGGDLKIRTASKDGVAIASILTLSHKKAMVYKYGCSDTASNKFGGTALLFWKAIQDAQANGMEELDMGRSDIDNSGLIAFKEHWGATRSLLTYWTYPNRPLRQAARWHQSLAKRAVAMVPDLGLQLAGTLLYRHMA